MTPVERIMSRRQINAMILKDFVNISFIRKTKVDVAGGGWRWSDPTPIDPQQVSLIPFKRRMSELLINTEIGDVPDLPYVLLGRHNLDIMPDDIFIYQGETFQVITIDLKREVRVAAHVDYFGGGNNA